MKLSSLLAIVRTVARPAVRFARSLLRGKRPAAERVQGYEDAGRQGYEDGVRARSSRAQ